MILNEKKTNIDNVNFSTLLIVSALVFQKTITWIETVSPTHPRECSCTAPRSSARDFIALWNLCFQTFERWRESQIIIDTGVYVSNAKAALS